MKKIVSLILCVVMAFACAIPAFAAGANTGGSFGAYDRVFIVGIDGAGRFIKDVETPNFDRIFADGAVDYTARAETITTSAQNWGSILTGVSYMKHGMTNESTGANERASDTQFPSIYTYVRKAYPEAALAGFGNWPNINHGIIENDIDVYKDNVGSDEGSAQMVSDYLDAGNAPKLLFVQLDNVDHAGHSHGSKSDEYFTAIKEADANLGTIYDAAERNGLLENALFIVVADHGHTMKGGHGGPTMRETNVTLAVKGKTVVKGGKMDSQTRNRDVAAIALYALGVERPEHMSARIPAKLFEGVRGEARPFLNDPDDAILSALAWIVTLITGIAG